MEVITAIFKVLFYILISFCAFVALFMIGASIYAMLLATRWSRVVQKKLKQAKKHMKQGELEEALTIAWSAYQIASKEMGECENDTIETIHLLAAIYEAMGHYEVAESLYIFALARLKRYCEDANRDYESIIFDWDYKGLIIRILRDLALLYESQGNQTTAIELFEHARRIAEDERTLLTGHGEIPGARGSNPRETSSLQIGASSLETRTLGTEPVDCVVYSKPTVKPGERFLIQVFILHPDQIILSTKMAKEFDNEAEKRAIKCLEIDIHRGSTLTFHLRIPGLVVDDPIQNLVWQGKPRSVQFGVLVSSNFDSQTVIGTVIVSRDAIPVGHLKFKLEVTSKEREVFPLEREPIGHSAHFYKRAFISYASRDRIEVLKRVQMLPRLGIDFFQDLLDLEPGERWEKKLYLEIDMCDLFLLFWSSAAKKSKWVMRELEYALARKAGDDTAPPEIMPIILEGPPPPKPPEFVSHLHFNDYFLYLMAGQRTTEL